MKCSARAVENRTLQSRNGNVSESYTKTSAIQSAAIAKSKLGVNSELEEFLHDENCKTIPAVRERGVRWSRAVPTN